MRLLFKRSVPSVITLAAALSVCSHASAQLVLSSNLVQVGVVVSDNKGPVRGLKAEDFIVLDEGKPRKIRVLLEQFSGAAPLPLSMQKNTFSNVAPANDISTQTQTQTQTQTTSTPVIILMDSLNSLYGSTPVPYEETPTWTEDGAAANAKRRLITVLKQIDLHTPVAVYGLGHELKMLCDFTCSREQLLDAVEHYDATDKTSREAVEPAKITLPQVPEEANNTINRGRQRLAAELNAKRGKDTMAALAAIEARVRDIPGRKNLLWLTSSLPFSGEAMARIVAPARIAIYPVDGRGLETWAWGASRDGDRSPPDLHAMLDKWDATGMRPVGIDAMEEMAFDTGGKAFDNGNDLAGAIRAVLDDRSVTYTLGFYVDAGSVDGKFHNLKIRVKTTDAKLRYARGYFAMNNQAPLTKQVGFENQSSQEAAKNFITGQDLVVTAVRSPFAASAVPLEVKLERNADQSLHLQGTVAVSGFSLAQNGSARSGGIVVYMVEQNAAGDVLDRTINQMQLSLTDQQFADYEKSGVQFSQVIKPHAETSVIRVIVRDAATSRIGSVIIPLGKVQ